MMALGEFPIVSLKDVRERHFEATRTLSSGIDPMAERKAEATAKQEEIKTKQREAESSFKNIALDWWAWWSIGKSSRHAATVMARLEADIFPAIGHLYIETVETHHVRQIVLTIEERGARDVAKRAHEVIGKSFDLLSLADARRGIPPPSSNRVTSWPQPKLRITPVSRRKSFLNSW